MSHLLQMRGLKHKNTVIQFGDELVASFTDAWIETTMDESMTTFIRSHLLQMRGLKLLIWRKVSIANLSHLLQMRGLKHLLCKYPERKLRRIFYRCVD